MTETEKKLRETEELVRKEKALAITIVIFVREMLGFLPTEKIEEHVEKIIHRVNSENYKWLC